MTSQPQFNARAKPKYNYKAKAVAVSGTLTRPMSHDLGEMVKTEILGGEGGYQSQRTENYRFHEILSIGAAYTHVTANEGPDGHFNTLAVATIEKLNVLDILTADRITARLVGLHHEEDFDTCPSWIIPLGSEIVNLRIAGKPYDVKHPPGFHLDPADPPTYEQWKKERRSYAHSGESFHVPGFGHVTCCCLEMVPEPHSGNRPQPLLHRLSMLQLRLGSPVQADLRLSGTEGDGNPP